MNAWLTWCALAIVRALRTSRPRRPCEKRSGCASLFVFAVLVAAADAPGCASLSSQFLPLPPMPC